MEHVVNNNVFHVYNYCEGVDLMNILNTRLQNLHGTEQEWLTLNNSIEFIPRVGEIIIYDCEIDANGNTLALPEGRTTPYTYNRMKVGDGIHNVVSLPFVTKHVFEEISDYSKDDTYFIDSGKLTKKTS